MTRWLTLPLAAALWLLLTLSGLQTRVDRVLSDALLRATAPPWTPAHALRLDIDDASLRELRETLGEWPYPRQVYALMLDYLREAGAQLVVMDIVFAGPREGDERFAEALQRSPPSVLAAAGLPARPGVIESEPFNLAERTALGRLSAPSERFSGPRWTSLALPAERLLAALPQPGALGLISADLDDDGLLRHVPLLHAVQEQVLPSLALAAWMRSQDLSHWSLDDHRLDAGPARWPSDAQGRVLPRLPPANDAPAPLPWRRVMLAALGQAEDAELAHLLAGRPVFVGSSAFFADEVLTPLGRFSGTAFNAAVFEALRSGALVRDQGPAVWLVQALLGLVCALPAWLWSRGRVRLDRLAAMTALALAVAVGVAVLLVEHAGLLVPPSLALYALGLGLLVATAARFRWDQHRERELLRERELAEAGSQAKTELLAQVSHEMRTPMNAVLGLADILARSPLSPREAHYVEVLAHAGRQVFALINDLLDNARLQGGKLELAPHAFDLVDLVELQLELLRPRAQEKGLYLRVFAQLEATGLVLGDSRRVAQIVNNLVGNALKFTSAGGVTVQLARNEQGLVTLGVQDTGIGIDPEQIERIFTPFAQAHASIARDFGGTGLGLSISRSLARLMGGDVRVQSQPGKGSLFEVTLQLAALPDEDLIDTQGFGDSRSAAPDGPLRLLLAEDNDVNAMVIEAMLEPLGHAIVRAHHGEEALAQLRAGAFNLVLMDMQMPVKEGMTATREWRTQEQAEGRERTPIVALTANAFDADIQASLAAGCDAHVAKPVSLAALLQALARYARQ